MQRARAAEELADIADEASRIHILLREAKISLQAQQQAAIIHIEAETTIGMILLDVGGKGRAAEKNGFQRNRFAPAL